MFKMDAADFWQHARAPFSLQYNSPNQPQAPHHTLHQSLPQEHEVLADVHPGGPATGSGVVNSSSSIGVSSPHSALGGKAESSHILQQHSGQQSYGGDSFRGSQSPQLSSHHLLFNAAAAAAAAAHLKSTAMQNNLSPMRDQAQSDHRNYGHSPLTALCGIKPKQEIDAKPTLQPLNECRQPLAQAQSQSQPTYGTNFYDVGEATAGDVSEADGRALTIGLGIPSKRTSEETQAGLQTQQTTGADRGLHTPQCPSMSPGTGGSSNSGTGTRPDPIQINKTLSQGQQSPQHSTTASGGTTTPDIKYSNDKMANEIQLQLSRSSSAAAISERTLEECWSTLQRVSWHLFRCLFMHKSAMQQIQQQIPRVGLGTHGVTGTANLSGNITPGSDTKPHQCQQCMKSFSSNHQLVQHIRVHTGEKPYKCSYCDRRFKQLSHVQQHTRLHTGERPYKCHLPDCGRAFIQLSNLQQHLRNHDAQVERAKNRPFHCNICGKGFATESSLRTHTSKQHAALIGGPNATSCPVCHKLFLGTEALVAHMKHVHKEKSPPPSGSALSQFSEINPGTSSGNGNGSGIANDQISAHTTSDSSCAQSSNQATAGGPNLIDSYLGKRRTANHPCPVCGKHYVNEGSLRKHLACHAETSQLTNSLRMWPCSVCQAVFTHENGLLTHMESMRMDPKHQFAAQYVLSRAAAEQRERESMLAVTLAASSGTSDRMGISDAANVLTMGTHNSEGSNSKCPSPSVNSECSSNGRLTSSTASDQDQDIDHGLSENENSNQNITSSTNNNNNCTNNNSTASNKMVELRLQSSGQYTMDTDLHVANRMSLMAAAAAAVAASRPQDGVDTTAVPSAAVQAAVVNLAAAMRMNNSSNGPAAYQQHHGDHTQSHHPLPHPHSHPHTHAHSHHHQQQQAPQHQQQQLSHLLVHTHPSNSHTRSQRSPNLNVPNLQSESSAAASIAMNMNVHMMRGSLEPDPGLGGMHAIEVLHQQQHHQQTSNYSQHAISPTNQQAHPHPQAHNTPHHLPDPETALRMHQAEAILRSHTEAAFRLATGTVPVPGSGVKSEADQQQNSNNGNTTSSATSNDQQHRFHSHSHQQEHQLPSSS
ncbi:uncharacterized protein LOC108035799 isoform X3 [Drosophila biarmipes]|uniref:uncharacterized protein LOC108035799 isoform X3 n=1 Tax=Drosophila biarmipes TaxID=125945 RepID=UPI0021CC585C|nr:uncharacterized protein LOC108035799 isoform X3 [Drosophila biarmipes]